MRDISILRLYYIKYIVVIELTNLEIILNGKKSRKILQFGKRVRRCSGRCDILLFLRKEE